MKKISNAWTQSTWSPVTSCPGGIMCNEMPSRDREVA